MEKIPSSKVIGVLKALSYYSFFSIWLKIERRQHEHGTKLIRSLQPLTEPQLYINTRSAIVLTLSLEN